MAVEGFMMSVDSIYSIDAVDAICFASERAICLDTFTHVDKRTCREAVEMENSVLIAGQIGC